MSLILKGNVTYRQTWAPMDADAAAYIAAVEQADGQALEETTKRAIDNFVLGCKADGIWDAIKASCILAGARTLNGALVPLKGTAPTNFNFVSGDYDRKTGLVGNGTSKYLDSNRSPLSDPQDNCHYSTYSAVSSTGISMSTGDLANGRVVLALGALMQGTMRFNSNTATSPPLDNRIGFTGMSRTSSLAWNWRGQQVTQFRFVPSTAYEGSNNLFLYRGSTSFSSARLAFYSIGEALDLARLDGRVTDLITAISRAF